ncbi:MAG: FISUMP domain-containing protein [Bacteroidales bacterium]
MVGAKKTAEQGSLTDIDGNTYPWVKIGEQYWMAQNLRATRYASGATIPYVKDSDEWDALKDYGKAYCFYDTAGTGYKQYSVEKFGALYTWAAAVNKQIDVPESKHVQGVCPTGWHLPSDEEWTQMERYLAENGFAYDTTMYDGTETDTEAREKIALSLATNSGWYSYRDLGSVGNTMKSKKQNLSAFSGLPAGYRHYNGIYGHIGTIGIWWTSTEQSKSLATLRFIGSKYTYVSRLSYETKYGMAVRCIRDY